MEYLLAQLNELFLIDCARAIQIETIEAEGEDLVSAEQTVSSQHSQILVEFYRTRPV